MRKAVVGVAIVLASTLVAPGSVAAQGVRVATWGPGMTIGGPDFANETIRMVVHTQHRRIGAAHHTVRPAQHDTARRSATSTSPCRPTRRPPCAGTRHRDVRRTRGRSPSRPAPRWTSDPHPDDRRRRQQPAGQRLPAAGDQFGHLALRRLRHHLPVRARATTPPISPTATTSPPRRPGTTWPEWTSSRPRRAAPSSRSATPSPTATTRRPALRHAGPTTSPAARHRVSASWSTPASAATGCSPTCPNIWQGVSALKRFGHDALGQPGVRDVILLEGINDIGNNAGPTAPR